MKSISCKIFGHEYHNINETNSLYKELECEKCHKHFTTDGYGRVVKLTSFWKDNHLSIEKYFQKV
ncbi:MAG: hypothetical protein L3J09_06770 [Flavobacteriaceae bacterium]|nr:hypothetical protein [Flavobacteriaceae bacterium]